jgi:hypothetical protein
MDTGEMQSSMDQMYSPFYYTLIDYLFAENLPGALSMESHLLRVDLEHASSHLAKAQGILWHLEHSRRLLSHSFSVIPNDLLFEEGLTQDDLVSGRVFKDDRMLQAYGHCVLELNEIAKGHLDMVNREFIARSISQRSVFRPLFLPFLSFRTRCRSLERDPLRSVRSGPMTPFHYPVSNLFRYFKAASFNRWH